MIALLFETFSTISIENGLQEFYTFKWDELRNFKVSTIKMHDMDGKIKTIVIKNNRLIFFVKKHNSIMSQFI